MNLDEDDYTFRVITAVYTSRCYLGVATYFEAENTIWLDCFSFSTTEMQNVVDFIKNVTATTTFLLNSSTVTNKGLLELLVGNSNSEEQIPYQTLKSSCWQEAAARTIISKTLKARTCSHDDNIHMDIMMYLSQVCDIERVEMLQSLGALVYYLSKEIFNLDQDRVTISSVSQFPKDYLLRMDMNTFRALQIFKEDFHPNWIRGKGKSKEGFSLFAMFDQTFTLHGRRKLHQWMSSPSTNINLINSRNEDISLLSSEDCRDLVTQISTHLKKTADMPRLMLNMKKASMKPSDWCKFYHSLNEWVLIQYSLSELMTHISGDSSIKKIFSESSRMDSTIVLNQLVDKISSVLDIPKCEEEASIIVMHGINAELDHKREIFDNIELELIRAAQIVLDMTPSIENLSVEYIPQLGFHVVIDADNWNNLKQNNCIDESSTLPNVSSTNNCPENRKGDNDQIFRFSFFRNNRYFLKNKVMDDMDEMIGDIKSEILDIQKQCLLDLEEAIVNQEVFIYLLSDGFATLDATISLALAAREYKLVRPIVTEESVLVIKGGRHLLQELTVETFVPNDTFAGNDKNISIITGPNGSGKSIYLKQIGIITYLAHIGSFVPCEKAYIGLTDRIFSRITSDESVSQLQSTFTIDLCQMAKMFRGATTQSLCLIDEFGKGTMPIDGIALLGAVLTHFVDMPCRTFCVLHLTEIFDRSVLPSNVVDKINCFKMDTISNSRQIHQQQSYANSEFGGDSDDDEDIIPLYKLKVGMDCDSEGILCAKTMGINASVTNRAKQIKETILKQDPLPVISHLRRLSENEVNFLKNLFEEHA